MITKQNLEGFMQQKKWAFVGVSQNKRKFGHFAYKDLKSKGYQIYPINPGLDSIDGHPVYPSLQALPEKVEALIISVTPSKALPIIQEAHREGIKHIWMQQGSESAEAIRYCQENGINYIAKECILMFAEPVTFPHNAHRFIWKCLGKLPQ